jgi:hypothetical protein
MGTYGGYVDTKGKGAFQLLGEHNAGFHDTEDKRARSLARHYDTAVAHATSVEGREHYLWIARPDELGRVYAEIVKYTRRPDYFSEKSMHECMGVCAYNVPDNVWNVLSPLPSDAQDYWHEWRAKVTERRAAGWREAARLGVKPGMHVEFDGDYDGKVMLMNDDGKTFYAVDPDGVRSSMRYRLRGWRSSTARIVAAPVPARAVA